MNVLVAVIGAVVGVAGFMFLVRFAFCKMGTVVLSPAVIRQELEMLYRLHYNLTNPISLNMTAERRELAGVVVDRITTLESKLSPSELYLTRLYWGDYCGEQLIGIPEEPFSLSANQAEKADV